MKYRKKPVIIDAVVWDETQETLKLLLSMGIKFSGYNSHVVETWVRCLGIQTLEGPLQATKGDYIIRGVKGEFYPCKPDIFELTYEKIEDAPGNTIEGAKN